MNKIYILLLFALLSFTNSSAQVIINEVSPDNQTVLMDNDGDYEDWVELYNTSSTPVNLLNYKLSDNPLEPAKWTFPNVSIPGNGYLTVFASGKNRHDIIDHWESAVLDNDTWKYTIPTASISGWRELTFNDGAWSSGVGGIGFGDGDDQTTVAATTVSVFMRKTFSITDLNAISGMMLYMDVDDGFVAYLNGTEIARFNMNTESYGAYASRDVEAALYSGGMPKSYFLPPSVFKPLIKQGNNVLAIQVHQGYPTGSSSDLSARPFLFLGINNTSANYKTLPAWLPAQQKYFLHTNFSISAGGESLVLSNASGTVLETQTIPEVAMDNSYGRFPNASSTWSILKPTTPNTSNGSSTTYTGYITNTPTFSIPSGFYTTPQTLSCSCSVAGAEVRYTIDGSKPTATSLLYSTPINIPTTRVIRAGCFKAGLITKKLESNTYFINDPGTTLPVFSISTPPGNLTNPDTGIYILGPNAQSSEPYYGANYWMDWEREVHVEYFDKNKTHQFEQDCGIKIFGGWSRANAMKSVRLIPADKYGKDKFEYPLFTQRPGVDVYDQIHLRNGGNDFYWSFLRDQTNHRTLSNSVNILGNKTNIDFSEYEPVVVFLNGQYWGVHHMRERFNHGYLESHHGIKKDEFEMLEMDGDVLKENSDHFYNMFTYITTNNMANAANYAQVKQWLDIENFVDYFIAGTYHTNWDWPHNNIKYWRPKTADGKWRYMYYDTDFSMGLFGSTSFGNLANSDELDRVIDDIRNPHSKMLKSLLNNTEFRNYFINRYADLTNTIYKPSNYLGTFNQLKAQLTPEMTRHTTKWPLKTTWDYECDNIKTWISSRSKYAKYYVRTQFAIGDTMTVTLNVSPAGAGVIKISTIIPDTYPWKGTYYNGVPVAITAAANPGYSFANWTSPNITITTPTVNSITVNISSANTFTANFISTSSIAKITISEINYNANAANDAGNWVELYNYGNTPMDLSGWVLKDDKDFNKYTIPNGTILNAGQYLVLSSDLTKFTTQNPNVTNKVGPIGFKLDNSSGTIRLFDSFNRLYLSMKYKDNSPWPVIADGYGGTLELLNPNGNLSDGTNWLNGCKGGSPGKAYTPCPCATINLGADKILCTETTPISITTGLSAHVNRSFRWFFNNNEITGIGTPYFTTSAVGKYRVIVDSLGCLKTDEMEVKSNLTFSFGQDVTLCDPSTITLNSGISNPSIIYLWTKNGLPISGETSSSLFVKTAGNYTLSMQLAGCPSASDEIIVMSSTLTPVDNSRTGSGTVNLSVVQSGNFNWYDVETGGTVLGTGNTFTTPTLSSTKTYYVEDFTKSQGYTAEPDNSKIGYYNSYPPDFTNNKLKFNASKEFTIDAVTVYTNSTSSNLTVRILNSGGTIMYSKTVALISGANRIPLGWNIAVGNSYTMDAAGTTGALYMVTNITSYSYKLNNNNNEEIVSITNLPAGSGYYPFFYKWEISYPSISPCKRVPVTATIIDNSITAVITPSGATTICAGQNVTLNANTNGGTYTHQWKKDGVDINGATTSSYIANQAGNYSVTNTIGGNSITSAATTVSVTPLNTVSAGNDKDICASSFVLEGSASSGTKTWSVITGNGSFANLNDPTTTVNNLNGGINTFRLTVTNGSCPSVYDEVTIIRALEPTVAVAGNDQVTCKDEVTLTANVPTVGIGHWESGMGTIENPNQATTKVTGLSLGTTVLTWVITNGVCPSSSDGVNISMTSPAISTHPGSNVELCNQTSYTLEAILTGTTTGTWSSENSAITFNDVSSPTADVSGLSIGSNILKWTVSDGLCEVTDEIEITVYENPSTSDAGSEQYVTNALGTLTGNEPSIGIGLWSRTQGSGFIGTPTSNTSTVGNLALGENIFKWTISNGVCPASESEVSIFYGTPPSIPIIEGNDEVTSGQEYTYSVTPIEGAIYEWTLPSGATYVSDEGSSSITVNFSSSTGGSLTVKVITPFGENTGSMQINIVTSISAGTAVENYIFYPNPFQEEGILKINSSIHSPISLKVTDMKGLEILRSNEFFTNENIHLGKQLESGVYIVEATYADVIVKVRMVKMK